MAVYETLVHLKHRLDVAVSCTFSHGPYRKGLHLRTVAFIHCFMGLKHCPQNIVVSQIYATHLYSLPKTQFVFFYHNVTFSNLFMCVGAGAGGGG